MEQRLNSLNTLTKEIFEVFSYWLEREASDVNRINLTPIVQDVGKTDRELKFTVNEEKYSITRTILYVNRAVHFQLYNIMEDGSRKEIQEYSMLGKASNQSSDSHTLTFNTEIYDINEAAHKLFEKFFAEYVERENVVMRKFTQHTNAQ